MENKKKLPEKKFRAGSVSATIWKNEGTNKQNEKYEFNTISIQRNYTDKDGNWKSTNSLRVSDLPKAELVLRKAYEHIMLKEQSPSNKSGEAKQTRPTPSSSEGVEQDVVM